MVPRSGPRGSPVAGSLVGSLCRARGPATSRTVVPRSKCGSGGRPAGFKRSSRSPCRSPFTPSVGRAGRRWTVPRSGPRGRHPAGRSSFRGREAEVRGSVGHGAAVGTRCRPAVRFERRSAATSISTCRRAPRAGLRSRHSYSRLFGFLPHNRAREPTLARHNHVSGGSAPTKTTLYLGAV